MRWVEIGSTNEVFRCVVFSEERDLMENEVLLFVSWVLQWRGRDEGKRR